MRGQCIHPGVLMPGWGLPVPASVHCDHCDTDVPARDL